MLAIVIENPMQLTIVNAVPFDSAIAFCATKVENNGESAITTIPQTNMNRINKVWCPHEMTIGDIRQQSNDSHRAEEAVLFVPYFDAIYPLAMHCLLYTSDAADE